MSLGGTSVRVVALAVLATAAAALGGLAFLAPAASNVAASEPKPSAQLASESDAPKLAQAIASKYGHVLALGVAAVPQPVAPRRAADPIDTVRLVGVVEKEGVPMAVFFAGAENAESMITLRRGERLFASWTLQEFDASSAVLVQGTARRTLRLFE